MSQVPGELGEQTVEVTTEGWGLMYCIVGFWMLSKWQELSLSMNCELNWCSRQEYVMGGSYIDYGYPVEPEGEATVQVNTSTNSAAFPLKEISPGGICWLSWYTKNGHWGHNRVSVRFLFICHKYSGLMKSRAPIYFWCAPGDCLRSKITFIRR